jgi:methylated-DNA-protein-cysteine methyltransferase related protein
MINFIRNKKENIVQEEKNKYELIRNLVRQIPYGKVATYGQIAELAKVKDARFVGKAISGNRNPEIPCHRVVKANGEIPTNYSKADWREQKRDLVTEGINFLSETIVDLKIHRWKGPK